MFYGFPSDKQEELLNALEILDRIYPDAGFYGDNMILLCRNRSYRMDKNFMEAFQSSVQTEQETSLIWRLHTLVWAARQALGVPGDFVECGVFQGFCSEVIFKTIEFEKSTKRAYLYDTFEGLVDQTSTEQERKMWNYSGFDFNQIYKDVLKKFSFYPNVEVVKGVVPFSFDRVCPEKIAFLHIDMNSAQAEIMALERLFDRVCDGGLIVLDDYGWSFNANQTMAEHAFMRDRGHSILELPTGQGLIIKHCRKQPWLSGFFERFNNLFSRLLSR